MKNKNNITELVFIIDRSGSMSGLESNTIGGFNSLIKKQKKENGQCFVSTVLFSDESEVIHDRLPLDKIKEMTEDDYCPNGCTALIDAIGGAIKHISAVHRYIRPEDVPEHTMFVITTDGLEIDSIKTADSFGIRSDRAVNYRADKKGTSVLYDTVCLQVSNIRNRKKVSADWSKPIEEDFEKRK